MIFIRKHGNQIAEHMRRRRKAVQEQNGGSISGTGFAIEYFQPLHVERAIENSWCNKFGLGRHKCLLEEIRDERLGLKEFSCGSSSTQFGGRMSASKRVGSSLVRTLTVQTRPAMTPPSTS